MQLSIVSFNIRCCDDPDGYSIAERAPRLSQVIHAQNPDLIALQEYRPAWEQHIARDFGGEYALFNKYRNETVDVESSPILWKKDAFSCEKTGWFWLSDTPETESRGWDELYNCYRMCVWAVLKHNASGRRFTFLNTHFGFGDNGQTASARLIAQYAQRISDLPTFVCGDFNMNPASAGYAEMTRHFTDANAVTARDWRATYHAYGPKIDSDEHIDYCFTNEKITPKSVRILDQKVGEKYPSDHFGLHILLEI